MLEATLASYAEAIAESVTLSLTMPLWVAGNVTRLARATFSLALIPLAVEAHHAWLPLPLTSAAVRGAIIGASLGLSASVVFGAVTSAGSLIDGMLAWSPLPNTTGIGSVQLLYQLGCMAAFFAGGGPVAMLRVAVSDDMQVPVRLCTVGAVAALARISFVHALALAAPAIVAQLLAAVFGGILARIAPAFGGIVMSAPAICACVGWALIANAGLLFGRLQGVVNMLVHLYASF
jgi:type III secretory pathway component EscT